MDPEREPLNYLSKDARAALQPQRVVYHSCVYAMLLFSIISVVRAADDPSVASMVLCSCVLVMEVVLVYLWLVVMRCGDGALDLVTGLFVVAELMFALAGVLLGLQFRA